MARSTPVRRSLAGAIGVGMALGVSPLLATPASAAHVTQIEFFSPFIDGATGAGTVLSSKDDGTDSRVMLLADAPAAVGVDPDVVPVTGVRFTLTPTTGDPVIVVDLARPFSQLIDTTGLSGPATITAQALDEAGNDVGPADTETTAIDNAADTVNVVLPSVPPGTTLPRIGRFANKVIVRGTTSSALNNVAVRDIFGNEQGPAVRANAPTVIYGTSGTVRTFAAVTNVSATEPVAYLNASVSGGSDETELAAFYEQLVTDAKITVTPTDLNDTTSRIAVSVKDEFDQPIAGVKVELDVDRSGAIEPSEIGTTGVNGSYIFATVVRPTTGTEDLLVTINSNQTTGYDPAIDFQRTVTLTAPTPGATPPSMPLNVNATPGDSQVTVTWDPPTDEGSSPIVDYTVTASDSTGVVDSRTVTATTVTFTGLTNDTPYTFNVVATNQDGETSPPGTVSATPTAAVTPPAPAVPGNFQAIAATRVYDSRGPSRPLVGAGDGVLIDIPGGSGGVVPPDATAVVLNLTSDRSPGNGHLVVWPAGETKPATSALNYRRGQAVSSSVVARVGTDGNIRVAVGDPTVCVNCSPTHIVVDVQGYFSTASDFGAGRYISVTPNDSVTRADTRDLDGPTQGEKLDGRCDPGPQTEDCIDFFSFPLIGMPEAAEASAVVVSLAVESPSNSGYIQALNNDTVGTECDLGTSNLNAITGQTRANLAVVSLGPDRVIDLLACRLQTHVIVDVVGFFTTDLTAGAQFTPTPVTKRLLDTRNPDTRGFLGPLERRTFDVAKNNSVKSGVPPFATHVVMTVTGTRVTEPTHLSIDERTAPPYIDDPPSSFLNIYPGFDVPNTVIAPLIDGQFTMFNKAGNANVVIDVVGYFAGPQSG